jgi:hypothetical protein
VVLHPAGHNDVGDIALGVDILGTTSGLLLMRTKQAYLFKVGLDKSEPLLNDAFDVPPAVSLVTHYWDVSARQRSKNAWRVDVLRLDRQVSASASQKISSQVSTASCDIRAPPNPTFMSINSRSLGS